MAMRHLRKPLSYNGNIIEGIKVTFKDGQIVDISAEKGDQVSERPCLEMRCACLGECAPVPDPARFLSQALPLNTLFDENAKPLWLSVQPMTSVAGGADMSEEELEVSGPQPFRCSIRTL